MTLAAELQARGFVYQHSGDRLEDIFDAGVTRTVYLGIDPTADSMHVGHLVPYMMLSHIMKAGHNVIVLMGGGTALIGDPSFKAHEREIVSEEAIKDQCRGLEENVRKITTDGDPMFVNNYDWLSELSAIEFLRDVGKHFTVNTMIKKDAVSARLESEHGISFTEFSYVLLQAYDYYHLHIQHGCDVQIGGSDQWGNISAGINLIRRKTGGTVHGVTMQLVTDKTTRKKFGKSEGNAVWLDGEKTSPYQFYQFWFNTADENVIDYLKLFTLLPLEEIEEIEAAHQKDPGARVAQRRLAAEVTAFVHSAETAEVAEEASEILFGNRDIANMSTRGRELLLENAPVHDVREGERVVDILVSSTLAASKNEARTHITQGAVLLGEQKVAEPNAVIVKSMFQNGLLLLRRGKRNVCVLRYKE